jgi:hypothetical protein
MCTDSAKIHQEKVEIATYYKDRVNITVQRYAIDWWERVGYTIYVCGVVVTVQI